MFSYQSLQQTPFSLLKLPYMDTCMWVRGRAHGFCTMSKLIGRLAIPLWDWFLVFHHDFTGSVQLRSILPQCLHMWLLMDKNWKDLSFWSVKTLITHYSLLPPSAHSLEPAGELHRGVSFTRAIIETPVRIDIVNIASTFPLIWFMTQL